MPWKGERHSIMPKNKIHGLSGKIQMLPPSLQGSLNTQLFLQCKMFSNWAVGSWPVEKMTRIYKEELSEEGRAAYDQYMQMCGQCTTRNIVCSWQCSLPNILSTQKLWTDPGDLLTLPPSHFSHCSSLHFPFHLQHPYLLHRLTLQLPFLGLDWKMHLLSTTPTSGHSRRGWEGDGPWSKMVYIFKVCRRLTQLKTFF